jgi:nitroimidazol reductase NimA-like FMN-containing flavoprotein (pyridoxamine 5'-phosphate oxidase superfamily)
MTGSFPISERTRMRRKAKRATYDKATIHAILDEALTASVATVIDGRPQVQPMIHVRIGDDIILHGLGGNRLLSVLAAGGEACINAMLLDALAMARRIEDHSMLYRSATVYGRGREVTDEEEKARIMDQVFKSIVRSDRLDQLEPLVPGYLGGTMVVRVPIEEAVGKVNSEVDTSEGVDGVWSGYVRVTTSFGPGEPDGRTRADGLSAPDCIAGYRRA